MGNQTATDISMPDRHVCNLLHRLGPVWGAEVAITVEMAEVFQLHLLHHLERLRPELPTELVHFFFLKRNKKDKKTKENKTNNKSTFRE